MELRKFNIIQPIYYSAGRTMRTGSVLSQTLQSLVTDLLLSLIATVTTTAIVLLVLEDASFEDASLMGINQLASVDIIEGTCIARVQV